MKHAMNYLYRFLSQAEMAGGSHGMDENLRGDLLLNEPMSAHTTWRVGGPADRFYKPADLADLTQFMRTLPKGEPIYWVGLGSNLLVRDAGIRGTVIYTTGLLSEMDLGEGNVLRVEAGVSCAKVARFGTHNDLLGAEFLAGIPGTMGGALAMNAGAFGGETWEIVQKVETINRQGEIVVRTPDEFEVGYRHVKGADQEWFVAAYLQLNPGDGEAAKQRIKELLAKRGATQPTKLPSCGSVFRNPVGDYAARLIESAGLKGICRGGACVSEKHANFIVNMGGATAAEIESLLYWVQSQVERQHGIRLQPEVRIIGESLDVERGNV